MLLRGKLLSNNAPLVGQKRGNHYILFCSIYTVCSMCSKLYSYFNSVLRSRKCIVSVEPEPYFVVSQHFVMDDSLLTMTIFSSEEFLYFRLSDLGSIKKSWHTIEYK
jgi:hypothetical protein